VKLSSGVTVIVNWALVPGMTVCGAETVKVKSCPVPESDAVSGLEGLLVVTLSVAARDPAAMGVNVT